MAASELDRHTSSVRQRVVSAPIAPRCPGHVPQSLQSSLSVFSEYLLIQP